RAVMQLAQSKKVTLVRMVIPVHGLGDLRRGSEQGPIGPGGKRRRILHECHREQTACADQKNTSGEHKKPPEFTNASGGLATYSCVFRPHRRATVAGQGWLAGPKPSLDAQRNIKTLTTTCKGSSPRV